jgi:membrane-bound lytic murein transglycosylase B
LGVLDVVDTEAAEKSFDHVIEARSRSQEAANRTEEVWKESTRRFNQTRHQEYAQSWYAHHERQLAALEETFSVLAARHRAERNRFARMLGIPVPADDADGPEAA